MYRFVCKKYVLSSEKRSCEKWADCLLAKRYVLLNKIQIMMTEEKIKKFINNPTSKDDINDWFSCVNFIYTGVDCEYQNLSAETIIVIEEIIMKSKDDALVSSLVEIEGFNFSKKKDISDKWLLWNKCINRDIVKPKKKYLEKLFFDKKPLKFIIFSEAPMLTWKKFKLPYSKYIFKNCSVNGAYRSAPYKAFNKPKDSVTNEELITTFSNHRVAFIDLIDLPLPINTKLRCKWNYEIKINCKPLTIVFLENALLNFLKEMFNNEIELEQDFEFAFMMPPQTAFGIIEYIRDNGNIEVQYEGKFITINYHKAIECNDNSTKKVFGYLKEEILPLYARIAMGGSNSPSDKLLKRALNIH